MSVYDELLNIGRLGKGYALTTASSLLRPLLGDFCCALVIMNFYQKALLDGAGFQVRAGTVTTPLVGDVVITDTAAEYCIDPPAGYTAFPVSQQISLRLLTGTLHEYATKSATQAVATTGTAFVPLPLLQNSGAASLTTARVSAAGGVAVVAELATTTKRHWEFANPAAGATGALPTAGYSLLWEPKASPPIHSTSGALQTLYTQIAATGTGPSYYAHLDFLEFISQLIGLA